MWDRVQKHEHVRHVQHDIIVDERMIRMRVRMEHIDEVHDERQRVIVRAVQHEQYEMEVHEKQHQQMHVKHVQREVIVRERQIKQHVEHENGVMLEHEHRQIVRI